MVIIAILIIGVCVFFVCRAFYYLFDHSKWNVNAKPDYNASIINITSEKVECMKNGVKFKTTVCFSDGFVFVTHKTNRKEGIFTYQIGIDQSLRAEIIKNAIAAHKEAVSRINK